MLAIVYCKELSTSFCRMVQEHCWEMTAALSSCLISSAGMENKVLSL